MVYSKERGDDVALASINANLRTVGATNKRDSLAIRKLNYQRRNGPNKRKSATVRVLDNGNWEFI